MTTMQKRFALLFVGLIPTFACFWLSLWLWVEHHDLFQARLYLIGWGTTIFFLAGIPTLIFGATTINCVVEDREDRIDRHYEHLTSGLRRGRAMLSRRLAPPVEEEEEA